MTVCLKRLYSQRLILLLRERERERGREGEREGGREGGRERGREREGERQICLCTPRKFVLFSVGTKNMFQRSLIVPG